MLSIYVALSLLCECPRFQRWGEQLAFHGDLMAVGAIYALQDSGLSVPGDMAVVGYDDREIASLARPMITTVQMPSYEMGDASAKLLSDNFIGARCRSSRTICRRWARCRPSRLL